ncbi:phospho-sugar mutase [Arthrobacter sp. 35W]|uniref:phospho-sugar mutase n=1 Tax=Arthrobacter sp. 35W TaxID=1132441 RepID=UPI0004120595|nr:phospho-sugar mutase [Arthrobacter sp. 35W]
MDSPIQTWNTAHETPPEGVAADSAALMAGVRDWILHDPDQTTRNELQSLVDRSSGDGLGASKAFTELENRFAVPLQFGTAGLRAALGGGPSRMNRAVVIRTTAGLSRYLRDQLGEGFHVVIGFDARHGSAQFARDAAAVVVAAGGQASLMDSAMPTPVLSFAVRHLDADAGVMVTASHNPARDNGYKVYLGGRIASESGKGVQIIAPADREISARVSTAPPADLVPYDAAGVVVIGPEMRAAYLKRLAVTSRPVPTSPMRIVVTPLHGVGGSLCQHALNQAGFANICLVPEQADPDPDFPTVPFPNPEEQGSLDMATDLARAVDAELLIAIDPDADRCSIAVPEPTSPGEWRQLTGDEVGALLGEFIAGRDGHTAGATMANSIVSSRLLSKIAEFHGLQHVITLTGFKWIARTENLIFGYEEALGYCTDPAAVRDKDGISAAVLIALMADSLRREGRTILDVLDDLARRHGLHATRQLSFHTEERDQARRAFEKFMASPPTVLAGSPVRSVTDLSHGQPELPPSEGLILLTNDNDRIIVRPSGTEPKLKCYLETIAPVSSASPIPTELVQLRLDELARDMRALIDL